MSAFDLSAATNSTSVPPLDDFQAGIPEPDVYARVPQELKDVPNWVCWRYGTVKGLETKVPYNVRTGCGAQSDNSATWTTFEAARDAADSVNGSKYTGIGFELGGTRLAGMDFDSALNEKGVVDPYALAILKIAKNPYAEISPSGEGLHAFFECDALPPGQRKMSRKHDGVEIYHGREGGRYLTVTGRHALGHGIPFLNADETALVYFLLTQYRDKKFVKLWLGDTSAHGGDQSSADFALLCMLARLTNCDAAKMEAYFSASGLAQREKWEDREDYRDRSIAAAIDTVRKETQATVSESAAELEFHLDACASDGILTYVVQPAEGQIDGWFPLGSVSMVGGSSGGSKTTLMLQLLLAQLKREVFLGHATCGRPFVILATDRGEDSYARTLLRMHMENEPIPHQFMPPAKTGTAALQDIVNLVEQTTPLPQIVFIESADFLVEDDSSKREVAEFMSGLQKIARYYRLAIILSVGSPKTKAGQGYTAKRDNISGTGAWGRLAETIVLLQYPAGNDMANDREVSVLLRNGPSESFAMTFNKLGRLQLQTEEDKQRAAGKTRELDWVREQARLANSDPEKEWWTALDVEQGLAGQMSLEPRAKRKKDAPSHATVYRWIQHAHAKGWIVQKPGKKGHKGRGHAALYQWNTSQTNPFHKSNPEWFVGEPEQGNFENEHFNSEVAI